MSQPPPSQPYGFAPHATVAVPPNFYYEEPEYVGDYSENEALPDASPRLVAAPNVTEIYRRKSAIAPTPSHCGQPNIYVPARYYYEAVSPQVVQQMRRPAVPTAFRRQVSVMNERGHYYSSGAKEDGYRNPVVYSSPQIAPLQRSATQATPVNHVVRRHPVTVRTPRYFRRPTLANVYKKPSTLCLPVACQPDPAVCRRNTRKHVDELTYAQHMACAHPTHPASVVRRHSVPVDAADHQKQNSAECLGELQLSQSEVDAVLARYENMLGDHSPEPPTNDKVASCSSKSSISPKSTKSKISNMKPRMPSTVKHKQERCRKSPHNITSPATRENQRHRPNSPCSANHLELEEITTEVLDTMLTELMESGCKNSINENAGGKPDDAQNSPKKSEYSEKTVTQRPPSGNSKAESNKYSRSFNYRDIKQNMSKSQHKFQHNDGVRKSLTNSETSSPASSPRFEAATRSNNNNLMPKTANYHAVDPNSAMELHRSKSYIVSLIDRALSKELGTVPDRPSSASHSFTPPAPAVQTEQQLNARQAINLVNKNYEKMDKGLCLEITQALTDSIVSNAAATSCSHSEAKHTTCSCNVQDEPLYVKQLKQLRWGHLKHIQREVRRLEDLEKFLDSCSSGSPL